MRIPDSEREGSGQSERVDRSNGLDDRPFPWRECRVLFVGESEWPGERERRMVEQENAHLKDMVSGVEPSELPEGFLRELEAVRSADVLCGPDPELDRAIEDAERVCPDLGDRLPNHAISLFLRVISARAEGDLATAISRVARASEAASRVCASEGAPARKRWAQMRNQLCSSLRVLGVMSEAEYESRRLFARAVDAGEEAVQAYSECDSPRDCAIAKGCLAHAMRNLASLEEDSDKSGRLLARAIATAENVRNTLAYGQENKQDQSHILLNTVSVVQLDVARIFDGEDPDRTPARAVEAQKAALDLLDRKTDPQAHALAQEQLGIARSRQAEVETGKKARRMLAAAAEAFEAALQVRSRKDDSIRWGLDQVRLAEALRGQAKSTGKAAAARLLERAAAAYEAALQAFTPEKFPEKSAYYHGDLAETLFDLAALDDDWDAYHVIDRARKVLQRAIPIAEGLGESLYRARLQFGLVTTHRKLAFHVSADKAMRLYRQALEHCEEALSVFYRLETRPEKRLMVRILLATVLSEMAYRCMELDESVELFDRSIRVYEEGLQECEGPAESQRAGILRNLNKTREERDFRASAIS